ncbi:MAG: alpha/beta fold hydrolase [Chloroflexota bacterium]|nr:alpha/beta fold hydrolase [Chloroflexota bacterium]
MRFLRVFAFISLVAISFSITAQDLPAHETITRQTSDDITLAADFYAAPADENEAPVIIALHMLNSQRAAYAPIIPDLNAAGYAVLNVDMRGHGASGGARDWDAAIADVADWIDWLEAEGHLKDKGIVIMGASIGANVAIISCAESAVCAGAIALSPGLDYRGVKPEGALVDGLADREALLVAAGGDSSSSTAIRQMFLNAKGPVTARMVSGRAHGTRLFDSDYDSLSGLITLWLKEQFQPD